MYNKLDVTLVCCTLYLCDKTSVKYHIFNCFDFHSVFFYKQNINITEVFHIKLPMSFIFATRKFWNYSLQAFLVRFLSFLLLGDLIKCIVKMMTKTCNLLYDLCDSSTCKLEGTVKLEDSPLSSIRPKSPIPNSSMVIKIEFSKPLHIIYYSIQNLMLMKLYKRTID